MRKILYPALALCLFAGSAFVTLTAPKDYTFKEGFTIAFKSKDPSGEFKKAKGTIKFDADDLASSQFDLSIDVTSINTGNSMQNKKLKLPSGLIPENILPSNLFLRKWKNPETAIPSPVK